MTANTNDSVAIQSSVAIPLALALIRSLMVTMMAETMVKTMHTAKMSLHCEIRSTSSVALITQVMAKALKSAAKTEMDLAFTFLRRMCAINRSGPEVVAVDGIFVGK